jgi:outer membrane protein OmpA-like peptidoglycan-associated protein
MAPADAGAQALAEIGTDNRGQAMGDLTDAQIAEALRAEGRVTMSGTFFETDSAQLIDGAQEVLFKLAKSLEQMPDVRLAVVGHTDGTGDFAYNVDLSERRAQTVLDTLIGDPFNVAPTRLVALGAGPIDPVASNLFDEGRALNRRVTFVLLGETQAVGGQTPAQKGSWLTDPITGCQIWTAGDSIKGEGAAWTGARQGGKANGRGSLIYWDAEGLEARYDGDVLAGKVHGFGKVAFRNKDGTFDVYDGEFRNGEPHGDAIVNFANGYRFEGELIGGVTHGRGLVTTPEGWRVRGEIRDGEGIGTLIVFYEKDGETYFGEVENEQKHGFGTLVTADEDGYAGRFENGEPTGPGMFEGADGSQYLGFFARGVPNGHGTAVDAEGTVYQGRFLDGKPEGEILVTKADGTQSIETWKDGSKVE